MNVSIHFCASHTLVWIPTPLQYPHLPCFQYRIFSQTNLNIAHEAKKKATQTKTSSDVLRGHHGEQDALRDARESSRR